MCTEKKNEKLLELIRILSVIKFRWFEIKRRTGEPGKSEKKNRVKKRRKNETAGFETIFRGIIVTVS